MSVGGLPGGACGHVVRHRQPVGRVAVRRPSATSAADRDQLVCGVRSVGRGTAGSGVRERLKPTQGPWGHKELRAAAQQTGVPVRSGKPQRVERAALFTLLVLRIRIAALCADAQLC